MTDKAPRRNVPLCDGAALAWQVATLPEYEAVRASDPHFTEITPELVETILSEAARFAGGRLAPLNNLGEAEPAIMRDGKVVLPDLHRQVWNKFADDGWLAMDMPADAGGQNLPLIVSMAAQAIFDRSCPAFGMLQVPTRSAVKLLRSYASQELLDEWLPNLVTGQWSATICISEVEAGSDVGRIRTKGTQDEQGQWSVTGEKQWISFGSHELTQRIGHCMLAKTENGISLFLVPDRIDGHSNHVHLRRVEDKLGLHLSPTCALGFEGAKAHLIGQEGKGLAQMFVMIANMRLTVGAMGLGIAMGASDIGALYASERRQGGRGETPVLIAEHMDVQRMLFDMASRSDCLCELLLMLCAKLDLTAREVDEDSAAEVNLFINWMMPVMKTLGGDFAIANANDAMQVLGGAGYTSDWPAEQMLRDARVLPVFEGTTGIQALDLLHRRLWKEDGAGLKVFLGLARSDMAALPEPHQASLKSVLDGLEEAAEKLSAMQQNRKDAEAGAVAFLTLASEAALSWAACRLLCRTDQQSPHFGRMQSTAAYWLSQAPARAAFAAAQALCGAGAMAEISRLLPDS